MTDAADDLGLENLPPLADGSVDAQLERIDKFVDVLRGDFGDFDEVAVCDAIAKRVELGEFADDAGALSEFRRLAEKSATARAEQNRPARTYDEAIDRVITQFEKREREQAKAAQPARDELGRFQAS